MSSSQLQPNARDGCEMCIKRSQSDSETEHDTKRQKLEEKQPLRTINIASNGDLMVIFESHQTAYNIDSKALQRASPVLYERCLAVRPADGSNSSWKFRGMPDTTKGSAKAVLDLVHSNLHQIPKSMHFLTVFDAATFIIRCEMFDRYHGELEKWYRNMAPAKRQRSRGCCRLWLAYKLGLEEDFKRLQQWAIFDLFDVNGKGALGSKHEEMIPGQPLDLFKWQLSNPYIVDKIPIRILDRIVRLRSEAVNLILKDLKALEQALPFSRNHGSNPRPVTAPAVDAPKNSKQNERPECELCLNLLFGCLVGTLRHPGLADPEMHGFPSLHPVPLAGEYRRSLEELCAFVDGLQERMTHHIPQMLKDSPGMVSKHSPKRCPLPRLLGREAVEVFIRQGLESPADAN